MTPGWLCTNPKTKLTLSPEKLLESGSNSTSDNHNPPPLLSRPLPLHLAAPPPPYYLEGEAAELVAERRLAAAPAVHPLLRHQRRGSTPGPLRPTASGGIFPQIPPPSLTHPPMAPPTMETDEKEGDRRFAC